MGTWNGTWIKSEDFKRYVESNPPSEESAAKYKQVQSIKRLMAQFEEFLVKRCQKLGFDHWSFVLELSLNSQTPGRLHFHAYWHYVEGRENRHRWIGSPDAWMFKGAQPHIKPNLGRGKHCQTAIDRGHYYCQCEKIGRVDGRTTYPKYTAFAVSQKWVMSLWQVRKLSHSNARKELIGARGRTAAYIQEIDYIERAEQEEIVAADKRWIDEFLARTYKPFRFVPEVKLWQLQYERAYWRESRFKFLVLTGPSQMGKTQYAKSLFGAENTLVVPCQNVASPNLKDFRRGVHKAILFDEVSSQLIHDNKAVFQANNDIVVLGQSPTQEYVYKVFLYGVALICCTNQWMTGIQKDSEEEEWLLANSIVYDCNEKMYKE